MSSQAYEGDRKLIRSDGIAVGVREAWRYAVKNSILWFRESMSAAMLYIPGRWVGCRRQQQGTISISVGASP